MDTETDPDKVKEGDHVILRKSDKLRLFQVHRNRDVWLEKNKFKLDGIIGQPYGTLFEVKDGQMVKMERTVVQDADVNEKGKDNRHLLDLDSNQKLKQEEIEQMKKAGVSGDHLIEQLIENSATFQSKTAYAQEKWVKKKKKKHLLQFTVLKPTTRLLSELQWSKGPARICNLRIDSLAQIMTMGNVHANSTVMVVESCLGLVTGAVLEKLGGFGRVISFYHGDSPMRHNLDNYDFPKKVMDTLYSYPLEQVNSLKHTTDVQQGNDSASAATTLVQSDDSVEIKQSQDKTEAHSVCNNDSANSEEQSNLSQTGSVENLPKQEISVDGSSENQTGTDSTQDKTEAQSICNNDLANSESLKNVSKQEISVDGSSDNQTGTDSAIDNVESGNQYSKSTRADRWNKKPHKPYKDRVEAKLNKAKEILAARNIIQQKNVDCLIVASKFYTTPIVVALIDFVAPSRQIVVYSQFKEALEDCYGSLREHKGLVNYRLTETWLREYQVLPNRTHPVIQMSGTGGYLLTATTVIKPGN